MRITFARSLILVALAFTAALAGCGYSSSSSSYTPPPSVTPGGTNHSILNIGDAPSDRILAFEITINSVVLTDSAGNTASVLPNPARIELTRLAGTFAPLTDVSVPQGTYSKATVVVSNPEIVFVDASGVKVEQKPPLTTATATVNFTPALTIGSSAMSINFDFDVANSVTFDASGNPSVTPTIVANAATASPNDDREESGKIDSVKGIVKSVATNSFIISLRDSTQTLTFSVGSGTQFKGITDQSGLSVGMQVEVSGTTQADGSLLATQVEVEVELEGHEGNGMEAEGLVTAVTGSPATSISVLTRDISSGAAGAPALGNTIDISIDSNTKFAIQNNGISLNGLPFTPTFNASAITAGQNVEADAEGSGTSFAGAKITLHEQAVNGTASAVVQSGGITSFTLTLPTDSALAKLTGKASITVYQVATTQLKGLSNVSNNNSVRVRGLLFVDGSELRLVAKSISLP